MEMYHDKMSPEMVKIAIDIEKKFSTFNVIDHHEKKNDGLNKLVEVGMERFVSQAKQDVKRDKAIYKFN